MKYMLLIYANPEAMSTMQEGDGEKLHAEYEAFTQGIMKSGEMVSGDPLAGNDTTTTVRMRNDEMLVTDGPFIETTEFLGGYYVIDVTDLNRAIELAGQLPGVSRGLDTIEIRPVIDLTGAGGS